MLPQVPPHFLQPGALQHSAVALQHENGARRHQQRRPAARIAAAGETWLPGARWEVVAVYLHAVLDAALHVGLERAGVFLQLGGCVLVEGVLGVGVLAMGYGV